MEWSVTEQGPRVVIEVQCGDKGDGLYKAYAVGERGTCLLGTLMPEGGNLVLRRTLTTDSLKRQGVWPVRKVECRLCHRFHSDPPVIPWCDEVLRRSARMLPRHTVQRRGDGFVLIAPFDSRAPFPLIPLFCLSRVENGRLFFSFHGDGTPYIFQAEGKNSREADSQRREQYGKSDHQRTERAGRSTGI